MSTESSPMDASCTRRVVTALSGNTSRPRTTIETIQLTRAFKTWAMLLITAGDCCYKWTLNVANTSGRICLTITIGQFLLL